MLQEPAGVHQWATYLLCTAVEDTWSSPAAAHCRTWLATDSGHAALFWVHPLTHCNITFEVGTLVGWGCWGWIRGSTPGHWGHWGCTLVCWFSMHRYLFFYGGTQQHMSLYLKSEVAHKRHGLTITSSVSKIEVKVHIKSICYPLETQPQPVLNWSWLCGGRVVCTCALPFAVWKWDGKVGGFPWKELISCWFFLAQFAFLFCHHLFPLPGTGVKNSANTIGIYGTRCTVQWYLS